MKLLNVLSSGFGLAYDKSWAIYSHGTGSHSPARIGQTQFEQGGVLDGMEMVIDGQKLGDALSSYTDDDEEFDIEEFLRFLIDEDWIEYQNEDCYQFDPGCPKCSGVIYGASFPNGGNEGSCLICDYTGTWDDEDQCWSA